MAKTVKARVTFYNDVDELDFVTNHPYWVSINGYAIKISKKTYEELMYMHEFDEDIGEEIEEDIEE